MKKALTTALMVASLFVLGGCSSMLDATYGLGVEKPADAPAGWASNREGLRFEREGRLDRAKVAFCNAAELGYPDAAARCEKYTLLEAAKIYFVEKNSRFAEAVVCNIKDYGPSAKALCDKSLNGEDIGPGLREYMASLQPARQSRKKASRSAAPQKNAAPQQYTPAPAPAPAPAPVAKDLIGDL